MKKMTKTRLAFAIATAGATIIASGCGGSSSDDDREVVTSRGEITGFGSVYVNGRKYHTDHARFRVDDHGGDQDDLRVGMIVTVYGHHDDAGYHADRIIYDNELKGPVASIQIIDGDSKTLTILGQTVLVTRTTRIDDDGNLTYDTIALGDVLEVSGYVGEEQLIATHIELQDDDDEIEIKGVIENLTDSDFEIRGFHVSYDENTALEDISRLEEGLFVEVEGRLDMAGTTLIAREIEAEDEHLDDDRGEIELHGVISGYDDENMTFTVQGQQVDASTAKLEPASLVLADGLWVEVEGHLAGSVLAADEIELEDDHDDDDRD